MGGVILTISVTNGQAAPFPHTHGGYPTPDMVYADRRLFSPRIRGLSKSSIHSRQNFPLFPVHMGVILHPVMILSPTSTFPRTHWGYPPLSCIQLIQLNFSPRIRGLSKSFAKTHSILSISNM